MGGRSAPFRGEKPGAERESPDAGSDTSGRLDPRGRAVVGPGARGWTRRSPVAGSLLGAGLVAAVQLGHGGAQGYAGLLIACLRVLEGLHLLGLEVSAEFDYLLHVPVTKLGELVEPLGALDPEFSAEALDLVGEVIPLFDGQAKLTLEFLNVDVRLGRRRRVGPT